MRSEITHQLKEKGILSSGWSVPNSTLELIEEIVPKAFCTSFLYSLYSANAVNFSKYSMSKTDDDSKTW